jgi:hypothetical protein
VTGARTRYPSLSRATGKQGLPEWTDGDLSGRAEVHRGRPLGLDAHALAQNGRARPGSAGLWLRGLRPGAGSRTSRFLQTRVVEASSPRSSLRSDLPFELRLAEQQERDGRMSQVWSVPPARIEPANTRFRKPFLGWNGANGAANSVLRGLKRDRLEPLCRMKVRRMVRRPRAFWRPRPSAERTRSLRAAGSA